MKEEFLHYVWQHRHFDFLNASTTDGKSLEIVHPGVHNDDAGPDFLQSVVVIGGMRWVGSVEIHCRSSDWLRHGHQYDEKYHSVILHVVYEHDMEIQLVGNEIVPTFELKGKIPKEMFQRYNSLLGEPDLLLCRSYLENFDPMVVQNQVSSVLVERMIRRHDELTRILDKCQKDWKELIYRMLAVAFGCKKNGVAFELLAQSLSYRVVRLHQASQLQLYALLFGQSGLLDVHEGDLYAEKLSYEYSYLRYKYRLDPIGAHQWNWLRLRPQNFPTLRIAQFAQLLYETGDALMDYMLRSPYPVLRQWLSVAPDCYWETHYQFGKETVRHSSGLGSTTVDSLIVNTVVPIRFGYARFSGDEAMLEDALELLERVGYEDNSVTRIFSDSSFPCGSAYDSQAQIELMNHYCSKKQCLRCAIGEKVVRKSK